MPGLTGPHRASLCRSQAIDKCKNIFYHMGLSRLYSILEVTQEQRFALRGRLVTSESECNPPVKPKEVRMHKTTDKIGNLLKKSCFRTLMYVVLITSTMIVNLDYIQSRGSSKADSLSAYGFNQLN